MRQRLAWLGLTPEPERELPQAVALLRGSAGDVAAERRNVADLVLYGHQRDWLRYLGDVTTLVKAAASGSPKLRGAARHAASIVLEHHRMLIGLPGRGYDLTAGQRADLVRALQRLGGDEQ